MTEDSSLHTVTEKMKLALVTTMIVYKENTILYMYMYLLVQVA